MKVGTGGLRSGQRFVKKLEAEKLGDADVDLGIKDVGRAAVRRRTNCKKECRIPGRRWGGGRGMEWEARGLEASGQSADVQLSACMSECGTLTYAGRFGR